METITVIIIVVLLIALGIFVGTQIGGGNTTGRAISNSDSYASQFGGGGCGR